jgi:hypothetical protein
MHVRIRHLLTQNGVTCKRLIFSSVKITTTVECIDFNLNFHKVYQCPTTTIVRQRLSESFVQLFLNDVLIFREEVTNDIYIGLYNKDTVACGVVEFYY